MKYLMALLTASILFSCFTPVCFAAGAEVSVESAYGQAGEIVEVSVVLSGNTGFSSLGLEIGYDASALELVEVMANSSVGATFTNAQELSVNPYNFGWDSARNINFNGKLATFKFELKAESGEYPVTISFYKGRDGKYTDGYDINYDENFNDLNLSYQSGKVTVKKFEITDFENSSYMKFNVSVPSVSGYLFAAVYDDFGRMIDVKMTFVRYENQFTFLEKGAVLKVFWFDSALRPVSNPLIKHL